MIVQVLLILLYNNALKQLIQAHTVYKPHNLLDTNCYKPRTNS